MWEVVLCLSFTNGRPPSPPVQLFYKNGQPFPAHRPVGLRVHISHVELAVEIPVTQEVLQEPNSNVVKVAFTVRKAGRYEITVKLGGLNVAYSPYYKIFQPGGFLVHSWFLPLLPGPFFVLFCPFGWGGVGSRAHAKHGLCH